MNTIQFQGHHSRIPHADVTLLPDAEHTLWHAWRLPSGNYIIQALTDDKRPQGVTHFLSGDIFPQVLTPLLATVNITTKTNDPNLIVNWYNEVASLKGFSLYGPPIVDYENFTMPPLHPETLAAIEMAKDITETDVSLTSPCPPAVYDAEKPRVKQFEDITPLTAENLHGDSSGETHEMNTILSTEYPLQGEQKARPTTPPKSNTAPSLRPNIASDKKPRTTTNTPSRPAQSGTDYPQVMEEAIRALASNELAPPQIDDFFKQILENGEHPLEAHITRLIAIPVKENSAAYQAVLTELGLVLRQKKQYELAKQCHLRALELAPKDERILFNIARTEYESGNIKAAQEYLSRCLNIAPDFNVAKNFLSFISADS